MSGSSMEASSGVTNFGVPAPGRILRDRAVTTLGRPGAWGVTTLGHPEARGGTTLEVSRRTGGYYFEGHYY